MGHRNHMGRTSSKRIPLVLSAIAACLLVASMLAALATTSQADPRPGDERRVVAHYHKDVECTITDIDARWCVWYWKVDIEYENGEYGLDGRQTLTGKDGSDFHDAAVGEHIAAVLLSDVDNGSGEVLSRKLGNIVISAGHDEDSVRLR